MHSRVVTRFRPVRERAAMPEIENRGVDDGVPIDLRGSEIGEVAHMSFQG